MKPCHPCQREPIRCAQGETREGPLRSRLLAALCALWAVGSFTACGVQGPARPPQLEHPARVTNLTAVEMGQALEFQFHLPTETADGRRLTKPLEVEILRSLPPRGPGVSKLPQPEVWMHLAREEWLPHSHNGAVTYSAHVTDQEFRDWSGRTVVFTVRTLTRGFHHRALVSEPSNLVEVPIVDVSAPVSGLAVLASQKALEVRFQPPDRMLGGEPLVGLVAYRVYRSPSGAPQSFALMGETNTTLYRDSQFAFEQTYYYTVRAVFGTSTHPALSEEAPPVRITPRDVFPPATPQGLTGISSAGGVELVWSANTEPDLAGYNVYCLDAQPPRRVNPQLLPSPVFRDTHPAPGKTLGYYVTAVDRTGNESKPSDKVEVETQ